MNKVTYLKSFPSNGRSFAEFQWSDGRQVEVDITDLYDKNIWLKKFSSFTLLNEHEEIYTCLLRYLKKYNTGAELELHISSRKQVKQNLYLELELDDFFFLSIKSAYWYSEELWPNSSVKCVVEKTSNNIPSIALLNETHPYFKNNKVYPFEITGHGTTNIIKKNGGSYSENLLFLKDTQGNQHRVLAKALDINDWNIGDSIDCEVIGFKNNVRLRTITPIYKDPFYSSFEEVCSREDLKAEYFEQLDENLHGVRKLREQYNSKEAFWVFTYAKMILPSLYDSHIKTGDLAKANDVNDIILEIQSYILNQGLYKAFHEESKRNESIELSELLIRERLINKIAIETNLKNLWPELPNRIREHGFQVYMQTLSISPANTNIPVKLFDAVRAYEKEGGKMSDVDYETCFRRVRKKRWRSASSNARRNYINPIAVKADENADLGSFVQWTLLAIYFHHMRNSGTSYNWIISEAIRFVSKSNKQPREFKKTLLKAAFHNLHGDEIEVPLRKANRLISLDVQNLKTLNPRDSQKTLDIQEIHTVNLIGWGREGYHFEYEDYFGLIPNQFCKTPELKRKQVKDDLTNGTRTYEANIRIRHISFDLKTITAEQVQYRQGQKPDFILSDKQSLEKGDILVGRVTSSNEFGVFLETDFGPGLIHYDQIKGGEIELDEIKRLYKNDAQVKAFFIGEKPDGLSLSFDKLALTPDNTYYHEFLENNPDYKEYSREKDEEDLGREFASVVEEFAFTEMDLDSRITHLKMAQELYSQLKDARSWLVGVYVKYFSLVKELSQIVDSFNQKTLNEIQLKSKEIKDSIKPKTLETFPESQQLLHFVELIERYGVTNPESLDYLFKKINSFESHSERMLEVVAKICLATNLFLSASSAEKENQEIFSKLGLKRLIVFLMEGVVRPEVLEEEDKFEKERKAQAAFYTKQINEHENHTTEFKASILTPKPELSKDPEILRSFKQFKDKKSLIEKSGNQTLHPDLKAGFSELKQVLYGDKGCYLVKHSAMEAIAAFSNASGGTLFIGVTDERKCIGLADDIKSLKKGERNKDGFGKAFDDLLHAYFAQFNKELNISSEWVEIDGNEIFVVNVKRGNGPIFIVKDKNGSDFVREDGKWEFFRRKTNSNAQLSGQSLFSYAQEYYKSRSSSE